MSMIRESRSGYTRRLRDRTPADRRSAQDDLTELRDPEDADDDERHEHEMFELDQTELEELGLTLDDPHQPGRDN